MLNVFIIVNENWLGWRFALPRPLVVQIRVIGIVVELGHGREGGRAPRDGGPRAPLASEGVQGHGRIARGQVTRRQQTDGVRAEVGSRQRGVPRVGELQVGGGRGGGRGRRGGALRRGLLLHQDGHAYPARGGGVLGEKRRLQRGPTRRSRASYSAAERGVKAHRE